MDIGWREENASNETLESGSVVLKPGMTAEPVNHVAALFAWRLLLDIDARVAMNGNPQRFEYARN